MTVSGEEHLMEELEPNVHVIQDSNGISIEVLKLKDCVVSPRLVKGFGDQMKLKLRDVRELEMRQDDILLCSYPKTGTVITFDKALRFQALLNKEADKTLSFSPLDCSLFDVFALQNVSGMP